MGGDAARFVGGAGQQGTLRGAGKGEGQHRLHTGQGDNASPGPQCPLTAQGGGPAVTGAARGDQHPAEGALVALRRAGGKGLPYGGRGDELWGHTNSSLRAAGFVRGTGFVL